MVNLPYSRLDRGTFSTLDLFHFFLCPLRFAVEGSREERSIALIKEFLREATLTFLKTEGGSVQRLALTWDRCKKKIIEKQPDFVEDPGWTWLYINTKNFFDLIIERALSIYHPNILNQEVSGRVITSSADCITLTKRGALIIWISSSLSSTELRRSMIPSHEIYLVKSALRKDAELSNSILNKILVKRIYLGRDNKLLTNTLLLSKKTIEVTRTSIETQVSYLIKKPLLSVPNQQCRECLVNC